MFISSILTDESIRPEAPDFDSLPENISRILAVSLGGIGDTIMFSPVLRALKKRYPEASVDLLLSNNLAQSCYSETKEIDRTFVVNTNHKSSLLKIASFLRFALSARLRGCYDLAVFEASLKSLWPNTLKRIAGIKLIIRYPVVADGLAPNVAIARLFDSRTNNSDAFISVTNEARKEAETACQEQGINWNNPNLLVISPSTHLPHRPRWQLHKVIDVVKRLRKGAFVSHVVVVGSAADGLDWDNEEGNDVVDANFAGSLSLLASAALIENCRLALCNDGGIMHVAGAVGCPLVALMPNAPAVFRPPGKHTRIILSEIPCSPCYPDVPPDCPDFLCREVITVDMVYDACIQMLEDTRQAK